MKLTEDERAIAARADAAGMAMRILAATGRSLGADQLVAITSAHIDGCLYHGDSGVLFAEHLAAAGGRVSVPTSLNVGALDHLHPRLVRASPHKRIMALKLADAYGRLGCAATWTCAPYQAGCRPGLGEQIAWGESNAVVFANSVLGARTNRYGDFLDICAAIVGRAPHYGLHTDAARRATVVIDTGALSPHLKASDAFFPVLGAWLGSTVGDTVAALSGLPEATDEDRLKALGAAAASSGAVGLFHAVGITPEAATIDAATGGGAVRTITLTPAMLRVARDRLSSARGGDIDAVALGSPHFSPAEFAALNRLLAGRKVRLPIYACTGRATFSHLEETGVRQTLQAQGVIFVVDTCVVVTEILPRRQGVLMTNSGKFAHYAKPNTGYAAVFGTLADCVETAVAGRLMREEALWR